MITSRMFVLVATTFGLCGCGMSGGGSASSGSGGNVAAPTTPATPATLDGNIAFDLSAVDKHPHYHGAYYVQDPEFHFPLRNTSSTTLSVPYTIRMDGVDIPGYQSPRHALTVPAHGSIDGDAFQNPYNSPAASGHRPSGTHVFSIIIDPDDMLHETNEGDNVFATQIAVPTTNNVYPIAAGDGRPDLQFIDPHIHGPVAQKLVVHFEVTNKGASSTGECHWKLQRDGADVMPTVTLGDAGMKIPAIAQDGRTEIVAEINEPMTTGEVKYTIIIDSQNQEAEVYETNNAVDRWVALGSPSSN